MGCPFKELETSSGLPKQVTYLLGPDGTVGGWNNDGERFIMIFQNSEDAEIMVWSLENYEFVAVTGSIAVTDLIIAEKQLQGYAKVSYSEGQEHAEFIYTR